MGLTATDPLVSDFHPSLSAFFAPRSSASLFGKEIEMQGAHELSSFKNRLQELPQERHKGVFSVTASGIAWFGALTVRP
jgi:hypothetical protein